MDARIRAALLAGILAVCTGASFRTPNFVVETARPDLAEKFARAAETYRHDLAIAWLGQAMPRWWQPCPVTIQVGPNLGAGGATTFLFDHGEVFGWRMTIQGSEERLLDSVLPHEITHMIFASYFRRPLPRWADEGGATSVEHPSECAKHRRMLNVFLRTNRGIAFNQMFGMSEYPADVMPLYAQGYAVADFLIQQGGRRKFVDFLADGLQNGDWAGAVKRNYGYESLGTLQNRWVNWVANGFPQLDAPTQPSLGAPRAQLASNAKPPRPEPNLIYRLSGKGQAAAAGSPAPPVAEIPLPGPGNGAAADPAGASVGAPPTVSGWHAPGETPAGSSPAVQSPSVYAPLETQVTRPQPFQQPEQQILVP
jgi:hypothetical protein